MFDQKHTTLLAFNSDVRVRPFLLVLEIGIFRPFTKNKTWIISFFKVFPLLFKAVCPAYECTDCSVVLCSLLYEYLITKGNSSILSMFLVMPLYFYIINLK